MDKSKMKINLDLLNSIVKEINFLTDSVHDPDAVLDKSSSSDHYIQFSKLLGVIIGLSSEVTCLINDVSFLMSKANNSTVSKSETDAISSYLNLLKPSKPNKEGN